MVETLDDHSLPKGLNVMSKQEVTKLVDQALANTRLKVEIE